MRKTRSHHLKSEGTYIDIEIKTDNGSGDSGRFQLKIKAKALPISVSGWGEDKQKEESENELFDSVSKTEIEIIGKFEQGEFIEQMIEALTYLKENEY